jgi:hypothetical protein
MERLLNLILVTTLIVCCSCEKSEKDKSIEGKGKLKGTIGLFEGNCMPSPGRPSCQPIPISTTIFITEPSEEFNLKLLIDSAVTSTDGKFEIYLVEGSYSLFIRDSSDFICSNLSCSDSCYCTPFQIKEDSITTINANLNHAVW